MAGVVYVRSHRKNIAPDKQIAVTNGAAARMLGISSRTLQDWRRKGCGPKYVRVSEGGTSGRMTVLYRLCDIEEWLDSHLGGGTEPEASDGARR